MLTETPINRDHLRQLIIGSLRQQGFRIRDGVPVAPQNLTKDDIRKRHALAVKHRMEVNREKLSRYEPSLLKRIAGGEEVDYAQMEPALVEVSPNSEDELLFRYVSLHWSIPLSSGYGRRLRFLVVDQSNAKLIGIIGLGDPVFGLSARDNWIGWDYEARRARLRHVMEAFILGAVPPYSMLLCGKLVAMLAASNEVRAAFRRKYAGQTSLIRRNSADGRLALITTTSALGRSSIYNRLRYKEQWLYQSVGFTRAWGELFFSNGLYGALVSYAKENCQPTAKQRRWGTGFRNRREVVRKCLQDLGFPADMLNHGIHRELFVVPLAHNTREFLRGEHSRLRWFDFPVRDLVAWFKERWLLHRANHDKRYLDFDVSSYRLWSK